MGDVECDYDDKTSLGKLHLTQVRSERTAFTRQGQTEVDVTYDQAVTDFTGQSHAPAALLLRAPHDNMQTTSKMHTPR